MNKQFYQEYCWYRGNRSGSYWHTAEESWKWAKLMRSVNYDPSLLDDDADL